MPNIVFTVHLAGTVTWQTPLWEVTGLPAWATRIGLAVIAASARKTLFFNIVVSSISSGFGNGMDGVSTKTRLE
jgi:hypothetical protein